MIVANSVMFVQDIGWSTYAVRKYVKLEGTPKVVKTAFREAVRR